MHQGDILPECGPSSARNVPRGCFIRRARLRLSEISLENASSRPCRALAGVVAPPAPRVAGVGGGDADRTEAEPFACSEMLLEDASSKTLWLRRRTKDDNCRIPSRQSAASVPWDSGGCGTAEFRVLDIAVDADRTEAEPFAAKRSETG